MSVAEANVAEDALRRSEQRYRSLFEHNLAGMYRATLDGRILDCNAAFARIYGYATVSEVVGRNASSLLLDPDDRARFVERLARTGWLADYETTGRRRDGSTVSLTESVSIVEAGDGDPPVIEGLVLDVTERKLARALLREEARVLERIAKGEPLADVLTAIALLAERQAPGMLCSVLLADAMGETLRYGAAPSLPRGYREATDGVPIGPGVGSCGTAAFRRQAIIVNDVATNPLWNDYREIALRHGLRACWSTPLLSASGRLLGTFAMYFHEPRSPQAKEQQLIEVASRLAALALERAQGETRLARTLDRSQRLFEITAAVNRGAGAREVRELVLDALVHGSGADRAAILLRDPAGVMRFVASRGLSEAYRRAAEGHSPWAPDARNPVPVVVEDVAGATELGLLRETILAEGIRALAFVPIFTHRLLGKFMLYYNGPYPADGEAIQFALTVARHIGLATQRDREERARQASHDQMQRLADHLQQAREEERTRIAREVHDELGQTLTALKLDLAWLKGRLGRRPELAARVAETSGLADSAISTVRRIGATLRPGVLDDLGLAPAVEWLAQDVEARSGIRCRLDASFEDLVDDGEAATHIFRLFQEALTNVIRHSGASETWLKLERDGTDLCGEIRDNGRGISKQQAGDPKALGLIGMRERARLLGGEIEFAEGRTGGTLVRFRCPLRAVKPQEPRAS